MEYCGCGSNSEYKVLMTKIEHPPLQNMKILYFFLYLWVIYALLDPDPATHNECGSGSTTLLE